MEYASNAKANAGLTLGIIGTSLGALASAGGLAGILGVKPASQNADSGDRAVTRYEMSLIQENTLLKANQYTDAEVGGVRQAIAQQAVHNAASDGLIQTLQGQVYQLFGLTKLVVPNGNVAPGWGPAFVVPGVPPVPTVQTTPPTVSSGGTTAAAAA